jgi:hypothetical protein
MMGGAVTVAVFAMSPTLAIRRPDHLARLARGDQPMTSPAASGYGAGVRIRLPKQSWVSTWSYGSAASIASAWSVGSVFSFLSIGSAGSALSVGSAGSILSIGSSGSILSIGASGSILSIGGSGRILWMDRKKVREAIES